MNSPMIHVRVNDGCSPSSPEHDETFETTLRGFMLDNDLDDGEVEELLAGNEVSITSPTFPGAILKLELAALVAQREAAKAAQKRSDAERDTFVTGQRGAR